MRVTNTSVEGGRSVTRPPLILCAGEGGGRSLFIRRIRRNGGVSTINETTAATTGQPVSDSSVRIAYYE